MTFFKFQFTFFFFWGGGGGGVFYDRAFLSPFAQYCEKRFLVKSPDEFPSINKK